MYTFYLPLSYPLKSPINSRSSSSSPSLTPRWSTSFSSLPTEPLRDILETVSLASDTTRQDSLTLLCLVNCNFLRVARPLLYQEVHIDIAQEYSLATSSHKAVEDDALGTLLTSQGCAKLVKSLLIDCGGATSNNMITFAYLLSHLNGVEQIKADRDSSGVERHVLEGFLEATRRHCPVIKHLRLPEIAGIDTEVSLQSLEDSFPNLEVYNGNSSAENSFSEAPLFHLRQLIATSPLDQYFSSWITLNSTSSLTSLTIYLNGDPLDAVSDLSALRNLSTLCITTEFNDRRTESDQARLTRIDDVCISKSLQKLISTVADLPIQHCCLVMPIRDTSLVEKGMKKKEPLVKTGSGICWTGYRDNELDLVVYASESLQPYMTFTIPDSLSDSDTWRRIMEEGNCVKNVVELENVKAISEYGFKVGISFRGSDVLPLFEPEVEEEEDWREIENWNAKQWARSKNREDIRRLLSSKNTA